MPERTLIIGTGELARQLIAEITGSTHAYYSLLGVITESEGTVAEDLGCPLLGSLRDAQRIIMESKPDRIIIALSEQRGHLRPEQLVQIQIHKNIVVETGADAYERQTGKIAIESLTPGNVLFCNAFRQSRLMRRSARASSVLVSGIGLILSLPLMAVIAVAIKLDSPGPVLFCQDRIGLGGSRFKLLKFRSMHVTGEVHSEWEADNSGRITRVGKWLRKFRLDELPQFINVLRDDMNIVGPRPHPVSNRDLFILVSRNTPQCGQQIPYYSLRSSVRPGITGWAQVRYKYANGLDEEMEKLRYDLYYVKHKSLLLDLKILLNTVKVVLLGHTSIDMAERVAHPDTTDDTGSVHGEKPIVRVSTADRSQTTPFSRSTPEISNYHATRHDDALLNKTDSDA